MKKNIKMKEVVNEGLIQNAIAGILKLVYSGKINDVKRKIETTNKDLAATLDSLKKNIEVFNKSLDDPETIAAFKSAGVDITGWPKYKR